MFKDIKVKSKKIINQMTLKYFQIFVNKNFKVQLKIKKKKNNFEIDIILFN